MSRPRPRPRAPIASILDLGMKLHVPYNNDFKLLAALGPYAQYIASIYLPCDSRVLGTGRYDRTLALRNWDRELGRILEHVRPLGIDVNLLLNASYICPEALEGFTAGPLYEYLQRQVERGIRWVTIGNLELATRVRRHFPDLRIDVSAVALIDSVRKARYWQLLASPDMICVDVDHTRNLALIRDIHRATGLPVKIIANSFCMSECPFKWIHYTHMTMGEEANFDCWQARTLTPWHFYKDQIVPPYYLRYYEGLVADVKVVDRSAPTPWLQAIIRHYAERLDSRDFLPDGGVFEHRTGLRQIEYEAGRPYYEFNCRHPWVKPLSEEAFKRTANCGKRCNTCDHCYDVWRKEWSVVESLPALQDFARRIARSSADAAYYRAVIDRLHSRRHNVRFLVELKLILSYCAREFRQVPWYLLAIAFRECGEPDLSRTYAARVKDAGLRAALAVALRSLRGRPVLRYLDLDAEDREAFYFVATRRRDRSLLARADLVEFYLKAGEPARARAALRSIDPAEDPDHEIAGRLLFAAFEAELHELVAALAGRWGKDELTLGQKVAVAASLQHLGRPFRGVLDPGRPREGRPDLTPLHFALRALQANGNVVPLLPGEAETFLAFAAMVRRLGNHPLAHRVVSLVSRAQPDHVGSLRLMREVLLDMNRRAEADALEARIAAAYRTRADALADAERRRGEGRLLARARIALGLRDYQGALLFAAQLAQAAPRSSEAWAIGAESARRLGITPRTRPGAGGGPGPPPRAAKRRRSELELEKVKRLTEFRAFLAARGQTFAPKLMAEEARHYYYVCLEGQRVGFLEMRHTPGTPEAVVTGYLVDPDCEERVDRRRLLDLAAERARRLGAQTMVVEMRGEVGDLVDAGWKVVQVSSQLARRL
ncbi:MAG: hypothetical protein HY906_07855 [Deltaproteobacteria bacterium]|nr:hypothetical protein [Deltaproteobacteria bacterium]